MVAEAYAPGVTLGAAFATLLKRILAPLGLLFIDPMHPASRRLAAPLLAAAVRMAPELTRSLLDRNRELTSAGYHVQVHIEAETSFVFLLEDGQRLPLRRDGSDYVANGRRFSAEDLAQRAESLSPNALLRPVVQDSMLPTVAYVGGPAELAYLAQSQVIYRALLGRMPVAVSRQSATIIAGRASRLMDRYDLALPDFFRGNDAVREKIARKLVPPEIESALGQARLESAEVLDCVERALDGFEPTLADAFKKSRRKVEYQFAKTERRAAREALRRDQRASADAEYLLRARVPGKASSGAALFHRAVPGAPRLGPDRYPRGPQSHAGMPRSPCRGGVNGQRVPWGTDRYSPVFREFRDAAESPLGSHTRALLKI